MYYIWHNNLVLNFSEAAFDSFQEVVNSLPFGRNSLPFPDGHDRVILHTPNDDISFAFDEEEFDDFCNAIDEAIYMNEVYTLMNKEPGI
jgi:hypothetical protein